MLEMTNLLISLINPTNSNDNLEILHTILDIGWLTTSHD